VEGGGRREREEGGRKKEGGGRRRSGVLRSGGLDPDRYLFGCHEA
jgi:hypothetical protein